MTLFRRLNTRGPHCNRKVENEQLEFFFDSVTLLTTFTIKASLIFEDLFIVKFNLTKYYISGFQQGRLSFSGNFHEFREGIFGFKICC